MNDLDRKIIRALADNSMNVSNVARELFMHRNTVVYHIEKIRLVTGLDPLNFWNLIKLVNIVDSGNP